MVDSFKMVFDNLSVFFLVFARLAAIIGINPVFSRKNLPRTIRAGLILWLTIAIFPSIKNPPVMDNAFDFAFAIMGEILVGAFFSFVFMLFNYMLFFAGEFLDMQMGLAMAKVFDPSSSAQLSLTSSMFNIIFVLFFFWSGAYHAYIKIIAGSFDLVRIGTGFISENFLPFLLGMFTEGISLAIKLTLPFIAAQFTVEVIMGVLMKMVPQIHVFVINIQTKVLMGFFLMFIYADFISDFMDKYLMTAMRVMENSLRLFV